MHGMNFDTVLWSEVIENMLPKLQDILKILMSLLFITHVKRWVLIFANTTLTMGFFFFVTLPFHEEKLKKLGDQDR